MDQVLQFYVIFLLKLTGIQSQFYSGEYHPNPDHYSYNGRSGYPAYDQRGRPYSNNIHSPREEEIDYSPDRYDGRTESNRYDRHESRGRVHPIYNPYIEYGYVPYGVHRNDQIINGRSDSFEPRIEVESVVYNDGEDTVEVNSDHYNEVIHGGSTEDHEDKDERVHIEIGTNQYDSETETPESETNLDDFKDMKSVHKDSSKYLPDKQYGRHAEYAKICNFMYKNHYRYHMNPSMLEMACSMYKNWAYNMKTVDKWTPTAHQKSWFDALGSMPNRKGGRRQKRQAVNVLGRRSLRREYRMMTDGERYRFHRAVNILKNTFVDGLSMYDVFVRAHQARVAPGAHFGPAFLGYHRELLLRFENALRSIDNDVSLPYWDSNLDYILGDDLATQSILWTDDFLGNGVGEVTIGPFTHWRLAFPDMTRRFQYLHRNLTVAPPFARTMPALMSDEAILHMLAAPSIRNLSWFVSPVFESHHGAVHNWIGGIMADLPVSPTDPVFFMHHAFIDCLWEQLKSVQKRRNPDFDPKFDYPNDTEALGVGIEQADGTILNRTEDSYHFAFNPMLPFTPLRNIDGHSDVYFEEFYACEPSPICSGRNPNCGSPYLFCERKSQRCAPKLQIGTPCEKVDDSDACFRGTCCNGICQRHCNGSNRNSGESQFFDNTVNHLRHAQRQNHGNDPFDFPR